MKADWILQHVGEEFHVMGAVTPPIFQTSLFVKESIDELNGMTAGNDLDGDRYVYSRVSNPTNRVIERKVAALEKTEDAKFFSSGMGAISAAILSCVKAGSHVVSVDTCYGPTRSFLQNYLPKFGIETTFVVGNEVSDFEAALRPETSLVYLESPSSLLFNMQDLRAVSELCQSRGIKTVIDNSYATPLFQQPVTLGIDLVCHTASKYLGGHSDLVAGVVAGRKELIEPIARNEMELIGGTLPPFPAWLILRGMRTLRLRVEESRRVGNIVAEYLHNHPAVETCLHAGGAWHPQAHLFESQMSGSISLMTIIPKCQDPAKVKAFAEALEIFQIGVSWGGYESLVVANVAHPADWAEPKWFVRLYVGLEDVGDVVADLERALRILGS